MYSDASTQRQAISIHADDKRLLDKVKESCSLPSDNVLSHKLGVTRAVISGWRNDRYPIPDERIAQLCAMAKLDGGEWMARIHAARGIAG